MKNSKFVDISCLCQVIGTIFTNPKILEQEDKYKFNKDVQYNCRKGLLVSVKQGKTR